MTFGNRQRSAVLLSVIGTVFLAVSTFGVHAVRTKSFELLGPVAFLVISLFLTVTGLGFYVGALWGLEDDLRPPIVAFLGSFLAVLLFIIAWQSPEDFFPVWAGILSSLIIAVAASGRKAFSPV